MANFKKFLDERNLTEDYIEEVIRQNAIEELKRHTKNKNMAFYFIGVINLRRSKKGSQYWAKHAAEWMEIVAEERIRQIEKEEIAECLKKM